MQSLIEIPGLDVPKASDVLANHLRQQILDGVLSEGTWLPVERSIATSSGLSRGTVREALRILEFEGLIEIRPGRAGGSIVRRPSAQGVRRSLDAFIRGRGVRLTSLLEIREAIEPAAAALAAIRRDEKDVDELERLSAAMHQTTDANQFLRLNVDWHVAVVRSTHNELMFAVMSTLSNVVHHSTEFSEFDTDEMRRMTLLAHDKVVEAIIAGDDERARRRMAVHVTEYRRIAELPEDRKDLELPD